MRKGLDYKEETLTKENFWDELNKKFPKGTQVFCDWIDKYKEAVDWTELFANNVKFHTIPYEMQMGIWIAFVKSRGVQYWPQDNLADWDLRDEIPYYIGILDAEEIKREYIASLTPEQRKALDKDSIRNIEIILK